MKTPKFFIAIAIAFAALSFGLKATAQTTALVEFNYANNSSDNWGFGGFEWDILLHDVNTQDDYYFDTAYNYDRFTGGGDYELGYVPLGTYTVTLSAYSSYNIAFVDWRVHSNHTTMENDHSLQMYYGNNYLLSNAAYPSGEQYIDTDGMYIGVDRF